MSLPNGVLRLQPKGGHGHHNGYVYEILLSVGFTLLFLCSSFDGYLLSQIVNCFFRLCSDLVNTSHSKSLFLICREYFWSTCLTEKYLRTLLRVHNHQKNCYQAPFTEVLIIKSTYPKSTLK